MNDYLVSLFQSREIQSKNQEVASPNLLEDSECLMGWVGRFLIWGTRNSQNEDRF